MITLKYAEFTHSYPVGMYDAVQEAIDSGLKSTIHDIWPYFIFGEDGKLGAVIFQGKVYREQPAVMLSQLVDCGIAAEQLDKLNEMAAANGISLGEMIGAIADGEIQLSVIIGSKYSRHSKDSR